MIIETSDTSFDADVLNSDIPVLVDFWAPWCAPCKAISPTLDALAQQYENRARFVKVNIDNTDLARKYGVRGVPTLMMFNQGKLVQTQVGSMPKSKIEALVNASL